MKIQRLAVLILIIGFILTITSAWRSGSATTLCVDPGGGGGCFTTIQAAINASGPGDTINVAAGTYTENVMLNKSVTLNGAQAGVNACSRSATESIIIPANPGVRTLELQTGSAGAVINGFTFSGGSRGIESTSGPINNLQILNNRIIGFSGNGVFLNDSGIDITVAQNLIDGASKTGAGDLFHLDTDSFAGFHLINNCIVGKGSTDTSADTSTGFFVDGNHNVSTSATPRKPVISGNTITDCQTGMNLGTRAFGSLTVPNTGTISNNTFSNNLFDGLQGGIQNTRIAGNVFSNNGRHGLALTSFGNTGADRGAQNCTVTCNTMTANGFAQSGAGIFFSATQAATTISTNHANNNNIFGNATGATYNGTETIDAENNWWGSASGPTVGSNPGGTGDSIGGTGAANIDYAPFRTAVIPDTDGDGLLDPCDSTLIKVTPSNLQTWQMQHSHCNGGASTGSQQFVTGPGTPPLGTGSLRFTIGSDGDSFETVRYPGLDTVRIDQLTRLEYSTYVTNFNDGQAPYILLNIDFNGDATFDDQIFFEPIYQSASFFPSNPQAQLVEGQWQTWDALNGGWWSLNNICGAGPGVNVKSLAQYLSCQPNARIINAGGGLGGFRIATGCGGAAWANFDGNIDNVSIGVSGTETTFDFDPDPCTITCPPDQTANTGPGATDCCATVNYPPPTNPGCGTVACSPPSGSCFPVGPTTVTCSTLEDGPSCTFTVTVTDTTPPVITCPMNQTLTADANCQAVATYTATATDICTASPMVMCTPPSDSAFPKGVTTVNCTATDGGGNTAMCSFTVTVNDTTPPVITCPMDQTLSANASCQAVATYTPTVTDNCATPPPTVTCTPPSGSAFPKGVTTVNCTATDGGGNTDMCSFTVTVNDTTPPVITCPGNQNLSANASCQSVATYTATATDNCTPPPTVTCTPPSGSTFPKGVTTVNCTAIDGEGNTAMCSFTVTVSDNSTPVITCPGNQSLSANANCQAVATYTATATDNCTTPPPPVTCAPPSGSTFNLGTTTVSCKTTDSASLMATCTFTVTVQDNTPPTITCPTITRPNDPNQCGAVVTFTPTVSDNCSNPTINCNPSSGSFFPVGTTTVACTARDAANNMASCTLTLKVNDTQAPSITCPGNITTTAASCPPSSSRAVNFTVTASDNCPGVTTVCKNQNNQVVISGSSFPVGTTMVTCTATDASNNTASCSFTVTVLSGCLQDDSDPSRVVQFNSQTGEYRFCCGGITFTGTGRVTIKGCVVTIQHDTPDRRVQISLDGAVSRGSASLQSPAGTTMCTITDRNTANNSCVCQ
jgi:hypothetical protein